MRNSVLQVIIILLSLCSIEAMAQKKQPRRLFYSMSYNNPAMPGNQNTPRYTSALMVEYTDGSTNNADIREIKRTIPGAKREFNFARNATWGQVGLFMPIFASFGSIFYAIAEKKPAVIALGVGGMVGGFWGVSRLAKAKRKHLTTFLDTCNEYYADQISKKGRIGLELNKIAPDDIQLGITSNSIIGINLTWHLSK